MKQIWIPKIGGPSVLEVREAPDPEVEKGAVRIRVAAAGINFADTSARLGLYPDAPPIPCVVGYEVSGTIDQVGEGVEDFSEGDEVVSLTRFGGYSDVVVVPAQQVAKIPDNLELVHGAAIPVTYLTAWMMLVYLGNVREGDKVLVHAAAGGVGQSAVQICKWKGAEIYGTASPAKHERLKEMGVDHCIDYRNKDFAVEVMKLTDNRGMDIILDAVGGKSLAKGYRCLAPLGRIFSFGASSATPGKTRSIIAALKMLWNMPKFKPMDLMDKNRGVFGVNLGHLWDEVDRLKFMLHDILEQVEEGNFSPVVDKTFPFDQASEAHDYIQSRKNFGKVLLTP